MTPESQRAGPLLDRRRFVLGSLASCVTAIALRPAHAARAGEPMTMTARTGTAQLLEAGAPATPIWGFDGRVPGPLVRVSRGGEVLVRLDNRLDQATTIHWHGIRIDNAMDGVPHLTQAPVEPGRAFDYRFTVPDAGTYWYHPHERSWEQVARGLYGILIVDEDDPPAVDQDLVLVLDDWRIGEDGTIHAGSFGHMMDWSHAGRLGNVVTINSMDVAQFPVRTGERLRLRLCNTANARIFDVRIEGHDAQIVALDGQPVEPHAPPAEGVALAPGQRADLIVDASAGPGSKHAIVLSSGGDGVAAGYLVYDPAKIAREHPARETVRLSSNGLPEAVDTASARRVRLVMEGGAMGRMASAVYKGRPTDIVALVDQGMVWALNGVAGMTDAPLFSARHGESVRLDLVNDTAWSHAIHWHGHHALVIDGGSVERAGSWRDTVLVVPGETVSVVMITDNPGKWMLHCHMLEHQVSGMDTWFEVKG